MIAFPASLALASLGDPVSPLDPQMCQVLSDVGDHRIAAVMQAYEDRVAKALRDHTPAPEPPPLQFRVPAGTRKALRRAYSLVYLVHEQALTASYLTASSPHSYPDPEKHSQALLSFPSPELIERELDRVSSQFAAARGRFLQLI